MTPAQIPAVGTEACVAAGAGDEFGTAISNFLVESIRGFIREDFGPENCPVTGSVRRHGINILLLKVRELTYDIHKQKTEKVCSDLNTAVTPYLDSTGN